MLSSRIFDSNNNVNYILINLLFQNLNSNNYGGSIYLSGTNSKLIISKSNFINCSSITQGGAIYIISSILTNITYSCFNYCFSTMSQAIYSESNNQQNINDNSFTYCSENFKGTNRIIYLYYGIINFNNINSSYNKLKQYDVGDFRSINYFISNFCTYFNNTLTIILEFSSTSNSYCDYSNFINNFETFNQYGLFYGGKTYISNSIFQNNFFNILLSGSKTVYFTNCYFYNNYFNFQPSSNPTNTLIISYYCNNLIEFLIMKKNKKIFNLLILLLYL